MSVRKDGHGRAPSIIGADVVARAMLDSRGDIQLEGRVEGGVRAARLTVARGAEVFGEISADIVTIRGQVRGTIFAGAVTICTGAHVEGDIHCEAFTVEPGAHLACSRLYSKRPAEQASGPQSDPPGADQSVLPLKAAV